MAPRQPVDVHPQPQVRTGGVIKAEATLEAAVKCMPADVMEIRPLRAFMSFVQAYAQTALSAWLLWHTPDSPLLLLPAWFLVGTCATGLFVIGHECGHGSYSRSEVVNEIFGTAAFCLLGWPYHAWKRTHGHHHAHTNNLDKDSLWKPLMPNEVKWISTLMSPLNFVVKQLVYYFYCGPLFFEASILHHLIHFNPFLFRPKDRMPVVRSVILTTSACLGLFYYLYTAGGMWLWLKMWFMPFLCFNFWLSTYTYFHHKAPGIAWKSTKDWNKAEAQLFGTVHVDYHPIIEFLHFDINWHIPHHVTVKIPWYNLRRATYALMQNYGEDLRTYEMGFELWHTVTSQCHVYDEKDAYKPLK